MEKMTITEALAEIKLIDKKFEKKKELILNNLFRYEHIKDPFLNDGGSEKVIGSEFQSIQDLRNRHERIRTAIAEANIKTIVTVGESARSIYQWLVWKREILEKQKAFLQQMTGQAKIKMDSEQTRPQVYQNEEGKTQLCKLSLNLDYGAYLKKLEALSEVEERLDGQLSLKNATVVVEF